MGLVGSQIPRPDLVTTKKKYNNCLPKTIEQIATNHLQQMFKQQLSTQHQAHNNSHIAPLKTINATNPHNKLFPSMKQKMAKRNTINKTSTKKR